MTEVAAAILRDSAGRILICKRGAGGSCAHLWEFPGGKREPGETLADCAARECREELGVAIAVGARYAEARHTYPEREVALTFYEALIVSGEPEPRVHEALRWVTPAQLPAFAFCPADAGLIRRLAGEASGKTAPEKG